MSRRIYLLAGLALMVVAILGVGLAVAQEPARPDLPALTPAQLLSKVAEEAPKTDAVSGDFAWTNDLLASGDLDLPGASQGLLAFLRDGSGRLWLQADGGRLEAQTPRGDTVLVSDGTMVWVYSSNDTVAREYTLPKHAGEDATEKLTNPLDLQDRIESLLDQMAPSASLEVTTSRVAGRDSYLLVLRPTAENTVFGEARAAFDAEHFVPLRLEVFDKSGEDPVLAAGFTSISFEPVDSSLFTFTPPAGITLEKKELELPEGFLDHMKSETAGVEKRPLTLEEARAKAGFELALPEDPPLAFKGAQVLPGHEGTSPVVLLRYGEGFGTVVVAQTKVSEEQLGGLLGRLGPAGVPGSGETNEEGSWQAAPDLTMALGALIEPTTVKGRPAFQLDTRLGSAIAWDTGEVGVLVAGSLEPADLSTFAASFR